MSFCILKNLTVGIYDYIDPSYINIRNNRIVGLIGKFYDDFLVGKQERNCVFKKVSCLRKDDNEDYRNYSAEFMLETNQLDVYARPEEISRLQNDKLENSKVVSVNSYEIGQFLIQPDNLKKADFSFNNLNLILFILIGYILMIIISSMFFMIKKNFFELKEKFINIFFLNYNRGKFFKINLLSFSVFIFLNLSLLNSTIKLDKVILDTSQIIDTIDAIITTKKVLVFFEGEGDYELLINPPNNSLLYKLFNQKLRNENEVFLIGRKTVHYNKPLVDKMADYIFFMKKISLIYSASFLISYVKNEAFFSKSESYHQTFNVVYMRKNLENYKKKFLHKQIYRSFEHGLFLNLFDQKTIDALLQSIRTNTKIFHSIDEFLSFYSCRSSDDVTIDNYKRLFLTLFFIQIIILFAFLINLMSKLIKFIFLAIRKYIQIIYLSLLTKINTIKLILINWILKNIILKIRR